MSDVIDICFGWIWIWAGERVQNLLRKIRKITPGIEFSFVTFDPFTFVSYR